MFGLAPHRLFPIEAEPGEVLEDRGLEFRPAARPVDILDPQQETAAHGCRHVVIEDRRQGVAEMQETVRTRRETKNRLFWS